MRHLDEYKIFEGKLGNFFRDSKIKSICKKYDIRNYTINDDGSIDVDANVELTNRRLKQLPLKFRNVTGYFDCAYNYLTSLEGSPKTVGYLFSCSDNEITTLEGAPESVGNDFYCGDKLRDIYGIPKIARGIYINDNPVYSIVRYFINNRVGREEWIELFNDLDIIQDGYNVILDRLKYFYEGTKLNIDVTQEMLDKIKSQGYKIIGELHDEIHKRI